MVTSFTLDAARTIDDDADKTGPFSTSSFTPAGTVPIYVIFAGYNTAAITPTVSDTFTGSGAWTERVALVQNIGAGPDIRAYAYSMITGASPGSGQIDIDWSGSCGGMQVFCFEGAGVDTATAEGVADTGSDNGSGSAGTVTLTGTSGNGVVAAMFHETFTAVFTWTAPMGNQVNLQQASPANAASGAYSVSEDASVDVSNTGGADDYVMIAMEIAALSGAIAPISLMQRRRR